MSVPSLSSAIRPSTRVRGDLQEQGRAGWPPDLGLCAASTGLPCLRQKAWVLRGDLRAHLMGSAGRTGGESDLRRPLGSPGTPLTPRPEQIEGDRLPSMRGGGAGTGDHGQSRRGGFGWSRRRCVATLAKRVSLRSAPRPPPRLPGAGAGPPAEPPSAQGGPHSLGPSAGKSVPGPSRGGDRGAPSLRDGGVRGGGPRGAGPGLRGPWLLHAPAKGAGRLGRRCGVRSGMGPGGPSRGVSKLGPLSYRPCGSLGRLCGKLPDRRLPRASHLPSRQDRGVSTSQPLPLVPGTLQRDTLAPNADCFTATVILLQAVPEKGDFTTAA